MAMKSPTLPPAPTTEERAHGRNQELQTPPSATSSREFSAPKLTCGPAQDWRRCDPSLAVRNLIVDGNSVGSRCDSCEEGADCDAAGHKMTQGGKAATGR